jgi:hypothetical protein
VYDRENERPIFVQEAVALARKQNAARALTDMHAAPASFFNQAFIDELLITLQYGEGVYPIGGGNRADGRQRIPLLKRSFENQGAHPIAQLPIDRLIGIPIRFHKNANLT